MRPLSFFVNKKFAVVLLFFITTTFVVHFLPLIVKQAWFLLLLILLLRTKDMIFWLVFYFFLFDMPFALFYGRALDFFPVTANAWVSFKIFVCGIIFFRALVAKGQKQIPFLKPLKFLLAYLVVLIIVGLFYGINTRSIYLTVYFLSGATLFYSVPVFVKSQEDLFEFLRITYPLFFLIFIVQILEISFGFTLRAMIVRGNEIIESLEETVWALRLFHNAWLNFFCFASALVLIKFPQNYFKKSQLYLVVIVAYAAIFLSATRGWILAYSFVLVSCAIFGRLKFRTLLGLLLIMGIIGSFIVFSPSLKEQARRSGERFTSVKYVFEQTMLGKQRDPSETMETRTTERWPLVMDAYRNSNLIFGYGYSGINFEYYDNHVGFASILLNSGIVGLCLIFYLWIYIIRFNMRIDKKLKSSDPFKGCFMVFNILLLGLIIIHSTSSQQFGYLEDFRKLFNMSFLFTTNDIFYRIAMQKIFSASEV